MDVLEKEVRKKIEELINKKAELIYYKLQKDGESAQSESLEQLGNCNLRLRFQLTKLQSEFELESRISQIKKIINLPREVELSKEINDLILKINAKQEKLLLLRGNIHTELKNAMKTEKRISDTDRLQYKEKLWRIEFLNLLLQLLTSMCSVDWFTNPNIRETVIKGMTQC